MPSRELSISEKKTKFGREETNSNKLPDVNIDTLFEVDPRNWAGG